MVDTYVIDVETRSKQDISKGAALYALHPSTRLLVFAAYRVGDPQDQISVFLPGGPSGGNPYDHPPQDMFADANIVAHNAEFEAAIWEHVLRWGKPDLSRWSCTAARARACGLPASLDYLSRTLRPSVTADHKATAEGKALIKALCLPQKDGTFLKDPTSLRSLASYCAQDVRATAAAHRILPALPPQEHRVWQVDQAVNRRGVGVDAETLRALRTADTAAEEALVSEFREQTGLAPTQTLAVKGWLADNGVRLPDMKRETLIRALNDKSIPAAAHRAISTRIAAARVSGKKLLAAEARLDTEGRVRGAFIYRGAQTGRWSSRGLQLHNFSSGWDPTNGTPQEALQGLLNGAFPSLPSGQVRERIGALVRCIVRGCPLLAQGDYRGIELRLALHYAGERKMLAALVQGADTYRQMASRVYGIPEEEVNTQQREIGKRMVLGLGYGLGALAFTSYLYERYRIRYTKELCIPVLGGVEEARERFHEEKARIFTDAMYRSWVGETIAESPELILGLVFCKELVRMYRTETKGVVNAWSVLGNAALELVDSSPGRAIPVTAGVMERRPKALVMHRSSGRDVWYWHPRLRRARDPITNEPTAKMVVTCTDYSRNGAGYRIYGPLLFSHAIQGTARDVLADALIHVDGAEEYTPVAHVHDEILAETANPNPEDYRKVLLTAAKDAEWSRGLPLDASCSVSDRWWPKA